MNRPSIDDVEVKDTAAWREAIAKVSQTKILHVYQKDLFPEGIGQDLVKSIAAFAVGAQQRMRRGAEFNSFVHELMYKTVGWLGSGAACIACEVLREHWIHGDAIGAWYDTWRVED